MIRVSGRFCLQAGGDAGAAGWELVVVIVCAAFCGVSGGE